MNRYMYFLNNPSTLVAQTVKRLPTMRETWVRFLGRKDFLEKEMATHSSILAWKIPWMEEPHRLQFMGSKRIRHDWATSLSLSPALQADSLHSEPLRKPTMRIHIPKIAILEFSTWSAYLPVHILYVDEVWQSKPSTCWHAKLLPFSVEMLHFYFVDV